MTHPLITRIVDHLATDARAYGRTAAILSAVAALGCGYVAVVNLITLGSITH